MGTWSNDLLRIAQIKTLLKQQINRLLPGSIKNDTPFEEYPEKLHDTPCIYRDNLIVGATFSDTIIMGNKLYSPEISHNELVSNDQYTSVYDNSNNWGYDTTKGFYNNTIYDSQNTRITLKVNDYRNICYSNNANVMPVTAYQSSETGSDYGRIYGSMDGSTLTTLLTNFSGLNGTQQVDITLTTFYPYLILYYKKDGSITSGEDRCYFKFDRINFTEEYIIDQQEVIYEDDIIE